MAAELPATEADVIVVGGGGSGLAAAAEAGRMGRSVVVLEKNPQTGGTTSWSVGSVTATNTPHQQRAGIQDSPQEHFEDLALHAGALAPRDNLALRRILVDNTTDMLEWLMELGVVFVGPMPEPPHRYPRMHNVVPNSKSFAYHLTRHCQALGVHICLATHSERLIEEDGRVVGVQAKTVHGTPRVFRARRGVVLASGDYAAAGDLKAELASPDVADVEAVNASSTGDGHRMALAIGATVVNGDIVRGPIMRFIPPTRANFIQRLPPVKPLARLIAWSMDTLPQWILRPFLMSFLTTALGPSPDLFKEGAILVNNRGERFTDELSGPAASVAREPERIAYIVFDDALAEKFEAWPHFVSTAPGVAYAYLKDYRRNRADIYHQADTLAGLAASMNVPADRLAETLARYNDADHGPRPTLARKPYYALGPIKSYVVFTDGGLKVSERLEVLRGDGSVIPGLYAAGSAGQGGLLLEGHGHHLGWAFISGRIAGRNAAFEAPPGKKLAMAERHALIAGVTGIIGRRLAGHLIANGWQVTGLCRHPPQETTFPHVAVDLTDAGDCSDKLAAMAGVTHVFYAARYDHPEGVSESVDTNSAMLRNLVEGIEPAARRLEHIHLVHGTKYYGHMLGPMRVPATEDQPRARVANFYFEQEDFIRARQQGRRWSYSTSRPHAFCDFARDEPRNVALLIAVHASVARALDLPLVYPGTGKSFHARTQFTAIPLLTRAAAWMATEPRAANQSYNVVNGDTPTWGRLWPHFAEYFGLENGGTRQHRLADYMADKARVWDALVEKHGLRATRLSSLVLWPYADYVFAPEWDIISSMSKARRDGFHETVDSAQMFLQMFDYFRNEKTIP